MDALARTGDKDIAPVLKEWLRSGDKKKRNCALRVCTLLAIPELCPALHEADPFVTGKDCSMLHKALAACGNDKYLDELHKLAQDESEYERWRNRRHPDPAHRFINWNYTQNRALDAIAKLGSPRSLPVLDRLAREAKDPKIRKKAARIAQAIRKKNK